MAETVQQALRDLFENNTAAVVHAIAGAGLAGFPLVGLNNTRRGEGLARDILRADCQILLTDAEHAPLLDGLDLGDVTVFDVASPKWRALVDGACPLEPYRKVGPTIRSC
ncbi:acyl-CoA synthetase [Rhodococcus pyridinivorans]